MLGPNIDSIPDGFVEKYNAVFYKTAFSMVLTENDDNKSIFLKPESSYIGSGKEDFIFITGKAEDMEN